MRILSVFVILLLIACSDSNQNHTNTLLLPAKIHEWISEGNQVKLIELGSKESYSDGHLPNAQLLERKDYRDTTSTIGGMMAPKRDVENLLSRLGVQKEDTLILYGEHSNVDACRFFWILENYGHTQVYIMDGGKKAWSEFYELSTEDIITNEKTSYEFPARTLRTDRADLTEVLDAMSNDAIQIVDTRSEEEYLGQPFINKGQLVKWKNGAKLNGTIPGSIHFHWTRLQEYNAPYGFKSRKDIIHELEKAGINPYGEIILFCQSGARSSHTHFALKHILGNDKVKNFDGSWIEWSDKYASNPEMVLQISSQENNEVIFEKLNQEIVNRNG